ncbi:MAG: alpha/beta fold hydrolase [Polyangiaceae bacterium]|nr:alpha/beta fold hydrolase [Polyangiaceae bacterium]
MFQTRSHFIPNGEGYTLALSQAWDSTNLSRERAPVLIIPGYGMSSFIFSFHPSGLSLEQFLAQRGFEVWRADFRGQGESTRQDGSTEYGLEHLARADVGSVVAAVLERTRTGIDRVDIVGCSLGGTVALLYRALIRDHHVGKMVAMGTPVRWVKVHPLVRAAFFSPWLIGNLPMKGTRTIARALLPQAARLTPGLLRIYLNPDIVDMSAAREMAQTVEDPNRHVNRQIAQWIKDKDLVTAGVNLSTSLAQQNEPLLVVIANGDGIVPRETAQFVLQSSGSSIKRLLNVGTPTLQMAHADMFVSSHAHDRVFLPMAEWLTDPTVKW